MNEKLSVSATYMATYIAERRTSGAQTQVQIARSTIAWGGTISRDIYEVGGQPLLVKGIQPPPPEPDRPRFEASGSPVPGYAGRAVKS